MSQAPTVCWTAVGAAVRGTSHQKQDLPCQDALQYATLPGEVLLAAVADGAGSAGLSDAGARCAVDTALDWLCARLEAAPPDDPQAWLELMAAVFRQARLAVLRLADEMDEPARDFAATLTCVVSAPGCLLIGQIGDGAVVARRADGELFTVTHSQRGEYANETNFLTQDDALEQVVIDLVAQASEDSPLTGLALMSDGLTRLALKRPDNDPHGPFFQPLFAFAEAAAAGLDGAQNRLAAFLASERVCQRTDDDKSLILAVRPAAQPNQAPQN